MGCEILDETLRGIDRDHEVTGADQGLWDQVSNDLRPRQLPPHIGMQICPQGDSRRAGRPNRAARDAIPNMMMEDCRIAPASSWLTTLKIRDVGQ